MYVITRKKQEHGNLMGGCADLWVYQFSGRADSHSKMWRDGLAFFDYPQELIEVLNEYIGKLRKARKMAEDAIIKDAQGHCGRGRAKILNDKTTIEGN